MNNIRNVLSDTAYNTFVDLYIRVSTTEQAEEGYSIGEQEARLRSYCEAMRWTVRKVHIDPGFSGGNTDRPALKSLIRDIEAGQVKRVVVYKLDRLSRSQLDTLYLIEKIFLANGVDFVSMTENFDTGTPFGMAMVGLLAVFAQLERSKIKERMGMGKDARAKEGKWHGGSSEPIGYDYDPQTGELTINEYERMQILEAAELFFKGTPLRTICNIFKSKGYKYRGRSGRMSDWDPKRLKYVFRNKIYIGYILHKGTWYRGTHPVIFDDETFAKLQQLMDVWEKKHEGHRKRTAGHSTYLGGMIFCKHCGGRYAMTTWPNRKGEKKYFYGCYSRMKSMPKMVKDPDCKNKYWKMDELNNIILGEIKKLALNPEYYHEIIEHESVSTDIPNKAAMLKTEINKLDVQISRFMDLYGMGQFDISQISDRVQALNEQRRLLLGELESLTEEKETMPESEVIDLARSLDDVLASGDLNEIRMVISCLIDRIELDNEDVHIHWRFA